MLLHLPPSQFYDYFLKLSQSSYLGEIISQALFVFQKLDCVNTQDVLNLLEFADADILNMRTTQQTLEDLTRWCQEERKKFETKFT